MSKEELTQKRLMEVLSYDMESGVFTWLVKPCKRMAPGSKAGSYDGHGYIRIKICKKTYQAHRLVFLYLNGSFPKYEVDHVNGIRDDNRFCNLRECTKYENFQNLSNSGKGKSCLLGSTFNKERNKYVSNIRINGKRIFIGYFDNAIDAHKAYLAKKREIHTFNPVPRD